MSDAAPRPMRQFPYRPGRRAVIISFWLWVVFFMFSVALPRGEREAFGLLAFLLSPLPAILGVVYRRHILAASAAGVAVAARRVCAVDRRESVRGGVSAAGVTAPARSARPSCRQSVPPAALISPGPTARESMAPERESMAPDMPSPASRRGQLRPTVGRAVRFFSPSC